MAVYAQTVGKFEGRKALGSAQKSKRLGLNILTDFVVFELNCLNCNDVSEIFLIKSRKIIRKRTFLNKFKNVFSLFSL